MPTSTHDSAETTRAAFRAAAAEYPRLVDFETRWLDLLPELRNAESRRLLAKKIGIGVIIASVVIGAAMIGVGQFGAMFFDISKLGLGDDIGDLAVILGGVVLVGGIFLGMHLKSAPAADATNIVRRALFDHFKVSFDSKASSFPISRFVAAELLPDHTRRKLSDHVGGRNEHGAFEACEAVLTKEIRSRNDDNSRAADENREVFNGLLVLWPNRIGVAGRTIVVKDSGLIGNFFSALGFVGERMTTDDPEFDRMYQVYTTEEETARQLVTQPVRDNLRWYHEKFGGSPAIGFLEDGSVMMVMQDRVDRFGVQDSAADFSDPGFVLTVAVEISRFMEMIEAMESSLRGETPKYHKAHSRG